MSPSFVTIEAIRQIRATAGENEGVKAVLVVGCQIQNYGSLTEMEGFCPVK